MKTKYHHTVSDQETLLNNMIAQSPFGTFFGISQQVFDQVWSQLTTVDGNSAVYISMEIGADLDVFNPVKTFLLQHEISDCKNSEIRSFINKFLNGPLNIPNYGGPIYLQIYT